MVDPHVYITYNCSIVYIYIAVVAAIAEDNKGCYWPSGVFIGLHLHTVLITHQYEDHFNEQCYSRS